jgi:predicted RNA-binding protein with PIN domain
LSESKGFEADQGGDVKAGASGQLRTSVAEIAGAMLYLVDGNNVMAQTAGWRRNMSGAKKRLLLELAALVAARKVKVRVVFDGAPDDEFPEGCVYRSVHVCYARTGSDADTRIREMVEQSTSRRDTVVVSSDKPLTSRVKQMGAQVILSGTFRRMLQQATATKSEKPGDHEAIDVTEWLKIFEDPKS